MFGTNTTTRVRGNFVPVWGGELQLGLYAYLPSPRRRPTLPYAPRTRVLAGVRQRG